MLKEFPCAFRHTGQSLNFSLIHYIFGPVGAFYKSILWLNKLLCGKKKKKSFSHSGYFLLLTQTNTCNIMHACVTSDKMHPFTITWLICVGRVPDRYYLQIMRSLTLLTKLLLAIPYLIKLALIRIHIRTCCQISYLKGLLHIALFHRQDWRWQNRLLSFWAC